MISLETTEYIHYYNAYQYTRFLEIEFLEIERDLYVKSHALEAMNIHLQRDMAFTAIAPTDPRINRHRKRSHSQMQGPVVTKVPKVARTSELSVRSMETITATELADIKAQCDVVDATLRTVKLANDQRRKQAERIDFERQSANSKIVSDSLEQWIEDGSPMMSFATCDNREKIALKALVDKLCFVSAGTIDDTLACGTRKRGCRVRYAFNDAVSGSKLRIEFVLQTTIPTSGPMTIRYSVHMTYLAHASAKAETFSVSNKPTATTHSQSDFRAFIDRFHHGVLGCVRGEVMEAFLIDMLCRGEEMSKNSVGIARTLRLFVPCY